MVQAYSTHFIIHQVIITANLKNGLDGGEITARLYLHLSNSERIVSTQSAHCALLLHPSSTERSFHIWFGTRFTMCSLNAVEFTDTISISYSSVWRASRSTYSTATISSTATRFSTYYYISTCWSIFIRSNTCDCKILECRNWNTTNKTLYRFGGSNPGLEFANNQIRASMI